MAYLSSGLGNDGRQWTERGRGAEKEDFPKLRGLRPYHQINVALEELQQRHELIE
jgi:hypothetical protein